MTTRNTQRPIILAALALLCVAFAPLVPASAKPPGTDGNASFPEVSDSWSPDGRFVVKNVDDPEISELTSFDFSHRHANRPADAALLVSREKSTCCGRPASDALAINDWDANDDTQCIVFVLSPHPSVSTCARNS